MLNDTEKFDEIMKHHYYFKDKFKNIKSELSYLQECYKTNRMLLNEALKNQKLILHRLLTIEKKIVEEKN